MFSFTLVKTKLFPYSGQAFLDILQIFYCEIALALAVFAALLFLASKLNQNLTFMEQKEISISLTLFFSFFLLIQGCFKVAFFFPFALSDLLASNYYFLLNHYTCFLESLLAFSGGFLLYFSLRLIRINLTQHLMEYPILFAFGIWFLQILVLSNHLLITFIGLVGFSLNLYVMIMLFGPTNGPTTTTTGMLGFRSTDQIGRINQIARQEASIKYFYLSTFSSSLILLSLVLFYTLTQTVNLVELQQWLHRTEPNITTAFWSGSGNTLRNLAVLSLIIGFSFKLSAFPAHFWAPEVYQGSSNSVMAFIILPVKIGALGVFSNILLGCMNQLHLFWSPLLIFLAVGSMLAGALGALTERKIKKFLAYSSINQVGFLLLGLAATNKIEGIQATLFFLIIYVITNLSFFYFFLQIESQKNNKPLIYLTDLNRLDPTNYKVRFSWTVVFFSLAGLPPFAGFFSKFYILLIAFQNQLYVSVLIGIVTSLLSAYYYIRVVKLLWFENLVLGPRFVFTGYSKKVVDSLFNQFFGFGLGSFLTLSFLWNNWLWSYCFVLAEHCSFFYK